ncbi:MAG: type IV pilus assembly protein PilM [Parcubacteria group bacterium]|nr:type IV pilus assembly protein PilM [Parcubacteria group bacterium]
MVDISFFKKLSPSGIFELWRGGSQSIVGVDLGSSSFKAVQLRKEREQAVLETYGELSVAPYGEVAQGQSARLPEQKASELLADLIREAKITAKEAVVAIPLRSSFVTLIRLPQMPPGELAKAIPIEARRYIPVPISEVVMDWWSVPPSLHIQGVPKGEEDVAEHEEVILVAIHRDVIEKYRALFGKTGLTVKAFEIEAFSSVRAAIGREINPLLIVDVGALTTKMIMVDKGVVRSAHSIDRGAQDLTLALSRSLGVDFARAETTKRETGLSPLPEHREMTSAMEPMLDAIFAEASRVALDYRRRYGRFMERALLSGGGMLLNGVVEHAVERFGVEVERVHAFSKVRYPAFLEPVLKDIGPSFAVAIGLALRELG